MEHIYIAMVDTPGVFAAVIRGFLRQKYIHVVVGMDAGMEEAYSFGRRDPRIPFFAGFEREDKRKILKAFPTADYMVYELACSGEQKESLQRRLRQDYRKRFRYHYAVPGLPFIAWGRPFYLKNQYTCSSYIARILQENRICIFKKHFSLVTPKDFYLYPDKRVIFEGSLADFVGKAHEEDAVGQAALAAKRRRKACGPLVTEAEAAMGVSTEALQDREAPYDKDTGQMLHGLYGVRPSERVVAVYGS